MNTVTPVGQTRWRVWCLWSDVSEILIDVVAATDIEDAKRRAVVMGMVSGLGTKPSYRGVHAVLLPE